MDELFLRGGLDGWDVLEVAAHKHGPVAVVSEETLVLLEVVQVLSVVVRLLKGGVLLTRNILVTGVLQVGTHLVQRHLLGQT